MRRYLESKERRGHTEHRQASFRAGFPIRSLLQGTIARGLSSLCSLSPDPFGDNSHPTLPQPPRWMQVPKPAGSLVRPFSLLMPFMHAAHVRLLHSNLVAEDQLPAV